MDVPQVIDGTAHPPGQPCCRAVSAGGGGGDAQPGRQLGELFPGAVVERDAGPLALGPLSSLRVARQGDLVDARRTRAGTYRLGQRPDLGQEVLAAGEAVDVEYQT